ncbi:DUF3662 and FHA domain-containing protein [Nocardioides sp. BP30]|uniref:DUF3662 and FHA domain-containing protein n=1 Tax=Nocardioides sp. BP30 TaxID=3036374 RepID=UPI002468AFF2|nr:DUF3662 and FHA domain-containing protein [Nocardioides sp. BP30]WGL52582.1 DUF3662 and FHA domain-containing protein [Nocardioides sp. BP30]
MGGLQRFEQRLESVISGAFARAFRSAVQPVEIAAALQRECDNNAQILSRERRLVPNSFHVELAPSDMARLSPYDSALASELSEQLHKHAEAQAYVFPGPIHIDFEEAADLTTGRFRIRSKAEASVSSDATATQVSRATAFIEVNGSRHPLHLGSLVVGRGTEADLRINDPGVSRRHAEFRQNDRQVEVHDLGSTNGMLVNGQRMSSSLLDDGAVVRVGTTDLVVRIVETDV